jgi:hypothetical protein
MASTYTPIATTTLGSTQASVTFSSLGSYTDIRIIITAANNTGTNYSATMQFNNDTGSNYSYTEIYTSGSSVYSSRSSNNTGIYCARTNTDLTQTTIVDVMNYSNSSTYKTILVKAGTTTTTVNPAVGLWRNTAAITSIKILSEGSTNFITGSTFTLYGIEAA